MTPKQAAYQARRAMRAEYNRVMSDPHSAGVAWRREDSAIYSGSLAYAAKLKEWGYTQDDVGEVS